MGGLTQLEAKSRAFDNMPPFERAAAVMHLVYFATTVRPDVDWSSNLAENWVDLDDKAQRFNLKILETWAENPALLDLWVEEVRRLVQARAAAKREAQRK